MSCTSCLCTPTNRTPNRSNNPSPPPPPVLGDAQKELLDDEKRERLLQVLDVARGGLASTREVGAPGTWAPACVPGYVKQAAGQCVGCEACQGGEAWRVKPLTRPPPRVFPAIDELRKERQKETKHDNLVRVASLLHEVGGGSPWLERVYDEGCVTGAYGVNGTWIPRGRGRGWSRGWGRVYGGGANHAEVPGRDGAALGRG